MYTLNSQRVTFITMKTLLGFVIYTVLVNTGTSLECEVCQGTPTNCLGKMETCEEGKDICMVMYSDSSKDGYVKKKVFKTCGYSKSCTNKTQYMDYGPEISMRMGIACCLGDSCHSAVPELSKPLNFSQRNGKKCPACFDFVSSTCKITDVVECRGPEDQCIELEATVDYVAFKLRTVQRGCVTKEICEDLSVFETKIGRIHSKVTKAECKAATPKQPPSSLESAA